MERQQTFDAFILCPKEDKTRTFVKGWAIYEDGRMKTLQIDERIHPYLHECVSFGFSDILVDFGDKYGTEDERQKRS